jgi:putative membrane protein
MTDAPWVSTFVALALIPVAFFFVHAYISGKKRLPYHRLTGSIAIVWDLSLSIFYMLYRLFGGQVEGSTLDVSGALLVYFIAHGIIAVVVIALELIVLSTALLYLWRAKELTLHRRLAPYLTLVWFAAFLSGEAVYIVNYVI